MYMYYVVQNRWKVLIQSNPYNKKATIYSKTAQYREKQCDLECKTRIYILVVLNLQAFFINQINIYLCSFFTINIL